MKLSYSNIRRKQMKLLDMFMLRKLQTIVPKDKIVRLRPWFFWTILKTAWFCKKPVWEQGTTMIIAHLGPYRKIHTENLEKWRANTNITLQPLKIPQNTRIRYKLSTVKWAYFVFLRLYLVQIGLRFILISSVDYFVSNAERLSLRWTLQVTVFNQTNKEEYGIMKL